MSAYLGECVTFEWSSRMCEKGTKGCKIVHPLAPAMSDDTPTVTDLETTALDRCWMCGSGLSEKQVAAVRELARRAEAAEADRDRLQASETDLLNRLEISGELRKRAEATLDALEWVDKGEGYDECAFCGMAEAGGHLDECAYVAARAALTAPDTPPDAPYRATGKWESRRPGATPDTPPQRKPTAADNRGASSPPWALDQATPDTPPDA